MPKRTSFSLFLLTLVFLITSLVYVTITNNLLNNTPYYKINGNNSAELTSIIKNEQWSNKGTEELYAKKRIDESFTAQANDLGSILVSFNTHNRSVDDKIIFRLKETGEKNWFYQATYDTNQIQTDVPFPFGFPIITQAKNKSYTFEIESLTGRRGNSISLGKTTKYFYTKYKFSKSELQKNPTLLLQFIVTKTIVQLPFLTFEQAALILLFTLIPFIIYCMYHFRKQISSYITGDISVTDLSLFSFIQKQSSTFKTNVKKITLLHQMDRKEKIRLCALIVSIGFYCAVVYHYLQGVYLHQKFPINSFLPGGFFFDFFAVYDRWFRFQLNGVGLTYYPGSFLVVDFIKEIFQSQIYLAAYVYVACFAIFMFFLTYYFVKTERKIESIQNAFIISFMSYPFLFSFQTANFEITTFSAVMLFFLFYKKNRFLSVFSLAYAISMKAFPGIFLVLLLLEKRYKDIFMSILFVILFTFIPLFIFDGGFNKGVGNYFSNFQQNQQSYLDFMVINGVGNYFGHSLLNGIRTLFPGLISPMTMKAFMFPYAIIASFILITVVGYLAFFEKTLWKRVACLVMLVDLLPYSSNDYKLLYIFIPLFLFFNNDNKEKLDFIYLILFSLLLIPKSYFYFNNNPISTLNIVANPFIMLMILLIILISGISKSFGEKSYKRAVIDLKKEATKLK